MENNGILLTPAASLRLHQRSRNLDYQVGDGLAVQRTNPFPTLPCPGTIVVTIPLIDQVDKVEIVSICLDSIQENAHGW